VQRSFRQPPFIKTKLERDITNRAGHPLSQFVGGAWLEDSNELCMPWTIPRPSCCDKIEDWLLIVCDTCELNRENAERHQCPKGIEVPLQESNDDFGRGLKQTTTKNP